MLLSIITATFQSDRNIFETAKSIIPQLNEKVEWIIKDSSPVVDINLISGRELEGAEVIFQEDGSLYQGLNQALRRAKGKYFLVLGAGDKLTENSLSKILTQLEQNETLDQVDIFLYSMLLSAENRISRPNPLYLYLGMSCPHPALVMRTEYARNIGFFDEKYLIASDYDLILRYLSKYRRYLKSDLVISDFKGGGMSEEKSEESGLEATLIRIRNKAFINELKMIGNTSGFI